MTGVDYDVLFARAREDAGIAADRALLITTSSPPVGEQIGGAAWGPGVPADRALFQLTDSELATLNSDTSLFRVLIDDTMSRGEALGLMRFLLEVTILARDDNAAFTLDQATNAATHDRYRGAGGAVVWMSMPHMRIALGAASDLVNRTEGPQPGRLHGPFGALLRREQPPIPRAQLPHLAVIFAALHQVDLEVWARQVGVSVDLLIASVSPNASALLASLNADALFGHLRGSLPAFTPRAEEIAAAPREDRAWRPLEGLIDRGLRQGTEVLGLAATWPVPVERG
jgi:hypothetical protein